MKDSDVRQQMIRAGNIQPAVRISFLGKTARKKIALAKARAVKAEAEKNAEAGKKGK